MGYIFGIVDGNERKGKKEEEKNRYDLDGPLR